MIYIVMGVAGCGKSTVGKALARELVLPFYDGDDFHPASNIAKMSAGIPLTDADRWPWLDVIADAMPGWEVKGGAVVACSALKEVYRQRLSAKVACRFVYLKASREMLEKRLRARQNHFMKPGMLDSQFATLEEPADAIVVDAALPIANIVTDILAAIRASEKT